MDRRSFEKSPFSLAKSRLSPALRLCGGEYESNASLPRGPQPTSQFSTILPLFGIYFAGSERVWPVPAAFGPAISG